MILKKNLTVDPKQEQSEKMLGDIDRDTGDSEKAIEHYKRAISINENFNQEPMSQDDSIAAVTACFNQFDSISTTATKCGIPPQ